MRRSRPPSLCGRCGHSADNLRKGEGKCRSFGTGYGLPPWTVCARSRSAEFWSTSAGRWKPILRPKIGFRSSRIFHRRSGAPSLTGALSAPNRSLLSVRRRTSVFSRCTMPLIPTVCGRSPIRRLYYTSAGISRFSMSCLRSRSWARERRAPTGSMWRPALGRRLLLTAAALLPAWRSAWTAPPPGARCLRASRASVYWARRSTSIIPRPIRCLSTM